MNERNDPRQRLLDAAIALVREEGVSAMTQTRVATAAGLRQSHLTYYFPKKADLLAAVLSETHRHAAEEAGAHDGPADFDAAMKSLRALVLDRKRMRGFLTMLTEGCERADSRAILRDHARDLSAQMAPFFGRGPDDPAVIAFIDHVRGVGLRLLLEPDEARPDFDPVDIARMFELEPRNR